MQASTHRIRFHADADQIIGGEAVERLFGADRHFKFLQETKASTS
jgi:hypothetical protein